MSEGREIRQRCIICQSIIMRNSKNMRNLCSNENSDNNVNSNILNVEQNNDQ